MPYPSNIRTLLTRGQTPFYNIFPPLPSFRPFEPNVLLDPKEKPRQIHPKDVRSVTTFLNSS